MRERTGLRHARSGVVIAAAAAILAGACNSSPSAPAPSGDAVDGSPAAEPTAISLLLPFPPSTSYFQAFVAEAEGFFADEGLEVTFEVADGSGQVVQQLLAGNQDWGIATAATTIAASIDNPGLRAYTCHTVGQIFRVVTPEGSDVQSVEDLKGGVVGVTSLSDGAVPMVEAILKSHGLQPGVDVEMLAVGDVSPALVQVLEEGSVNAYSGASNNLSALRVAGAKLRDITPEDFAATPSSCMITTDEVLGDPAGRRIAAAIGRAWARASAFGAADKAKALEIVCEANPAGCEKRELAEAQITDTLVTIATDDPDFRYGKLDLEGWKLAAQILADSGTTPHVVDVTPLIDSPEVREIQEQIRAVQQGS